MWPPAGLTYRCAQRRAKAWLCLGSSRSKLPNRAVCSAAGWSIWHRGGTQSCGLSSQGLSMHATTPTKAKGRHVLCVLELGGYICADLLPPQLQSPLRLQPCLLAAGLSEGHAPSAAPCRCPLILSRQLPPAPTLPESWLCTASHSPASSLQWRLCRQLGSRKTPFCNFHTLHNRP